MNYKHNIIRNYLENGLVMDKFRDNDRKHHRFQTSGDRPVGEAWYALNHLLKYFQSVLRVYFFEKLWCKIKSKVVKMQV